MNTLRRVGSAFHGLLNPLLKAKKPIITKITNVGAYYQLQRIKSILKTSPFMSYETIQSLHQRLGRIEEAITTQPNTTSKTNFQRLILDLKKQIDLRLPDALFANLLDLISKNGVDEKLITTISEIQEKLKHLELENFESLVLYFFTKFNLALINEASGNFEKAEECYLQLSSLAPESIDLLSGMTLEENIGSAALSRYTMLPTIEVSPRKLTEDYVDLSRKIKYEEMKAILKELQRDLVLFQIEKVLEN